jgi:hypothetical protein
MSVASEVNLERTTRWLRCFFYLWAWSIIFHNGKTNEWIEYPIDVMTTAFAVGVLVGGAKTSLFILLLIAQCSAILVRMPNATNHSIFALIAASTMLCGFIYAAIPNRLGTICYSKWLRAVVPAIRMELLLLYFWVVFHKLNRDFFDPEWSAAVEHLNNLSLTLNKLGLPGIFQSAFMQYASIWGTVIVEATIPLLLLRSRTRVIGICVGFCFHFVLGFEDYYDFTAMMYAGLFLFLPMPTIDTVRSAMNDIRKGLPILRIPGAVAFLLSVVFILLAANVDAENGAVSQSFRVFKVLWLLWSLWLAAIIAYALWVSRSFTFGVRSDSDFRWLARPIWFKAFPLIVFLNGLQPYLGLKTRSVFAMFSNLRTEGPKSNHLIMPDSAKIFSIQDDLVRIIDSSDPQFKQIASSRTRFPFYNLRSMTSSRAQAGYENIYLVFERNGEVVEVHNAEEDPELSTPYPYLMRKYFLFGSMNDGDRQVNRH